MAVPTSGNFSMFGSNDNTTISGAIVEGGANPTTVANTNNFNDLILLSDINRFDPNFSEGATQLAQITKTSQFRGYPIPTTTTTTSTTTLEPPTEITCVDGQTIFFSDQYEPSNYYQYPEILISSTSTECGQLNWNALDRPNRFNIFDSTGLIATSGWVGTANYSGPWGSTLSTPSTGIINYNFNSTTGRYILVEAGPADPNDPITDAYEFTLFCQDCANTTTTTTTSTTTLQPTTTTSTTTLQPTTTTSTTTLEPTTTTSTTTLQPVNREYRAEDCGTLSERILVLPGTSLIIGGVYRITSETTSTCFTIVEDLGNTSDPVTYILSDTESQNPIAIQIVPNGCTDTTLCTQL
jgi:hypothetical protein